MLPPVLPCLPWFVGLFDTTFFIAFVVRWGIFLNFFFSWVGFASSLTKLWLQRWLVRLWQCACKMRGLFVSMSILRGLLVNDLILLYKISIGAYTFPLVKEIFRCDAFPIDE